MANPLIPTSDFNYIEGTEGVDDLTGLNTSDYIIGKGGNDKIRGWNGDDVINAGDGDDIVSGDNIIEFTTQSDDTIYGERGNDKLFGRFGDDYIDGGEANDLLFGGSGSDHLLGGDGNDRLFGGLVNGEERYDSGVDAADVLEGQAGNDKLYGHEGNDILTGADPSTGGLHEYDQLTGGEGDDTFVLGDRNRAYYTEGRGGDHAVIRDFEDGDVIQLNGDSSDYLMTYKGSQGKSFLKYLGNNYDLVAVFDGVDMTQISLDSSTFEYV